jgi:ABC-2 type transport system permease protein
MAVMSDSSAAVPATGREWETPLPPAFNITALWALFGLTLRQLVRGRRLLVLAGLLALPCLVAVLSRLPERPAPPATMELALVFTLIPHALVPLMALLYASGMIQDEVEDQTLTYLLIRPLPRRALYVTKLLASLLVTILLATVFTTATYVTIYWGRPEFWGEIFPARPLQAALLLGLALVGYCSLFGCLSLFIQRSLVVGIAYILLFEGLLSGFDFAVRRLTVTYYFRVLSERWLDLDVPAWSLDLNTAPSSLSCVLTVLIASLAATALAAIGFAGREFRMKTPEGS